MSEFKIEIFEFPRSIIIEATKRHLIVSDDSRIFELADNRANMIHQCDFNQVLAITDDGMWEIKKDGLSAFYAELFNIYHDEDFKSQRIEDACGGRVFFEGGYGIFVDLIGGFIRSVNLEKKSNTQFDGAISKIKLQNDLYCIDMEKDELICLDYELHIKWKFNLPSDHSRSINITQDHYETPKICSNTVIVYGGIELESYKNAKFFGLSRDTGRVVWEMNFEYFVSSIFVVDNKCYLAYQGDIIVLDGNTGEVLIREPSGFEDFISVYPFNGHLFCFSGEERKAKVFLQDAKQVKQEIDFPEAYCPSYAHDIIDRGSSLAVYAFRTNPLLNSANKAVAIVSAGDEKSPPSRIMPRVEMAVKAIKEKGEKVYVIETDHDNFDDILRYGEIWLRETACNSGWEPYIKNPNQDRKHRGKMVFHVKRVLTEQETAILQEMVVYVQGHLKKLFFHPGAGKKYDFSIELRVN